jgi:membrane protease subunit HflK
MERLGGLIERITLAMAGKRSPWGKPTGDSEGSGERPDDGDGESTPPTGEDNPRGPRNPWLPGGGEERPRRSANIEDIFKHRAAAGARADRTSACPSGRAAAAGCRSSGWRWSGSGCS